MKDVVAFNELFYLSIRKKYDSLGKDRQEMQKK